MPFGVIAITAHVTVALDGKLASPRIYQLSLALLALAALTMAIPGHRRAAWTISLGLFVYLASASSLVLSQSASHSELTPLLLLPVLAMATTGSSTQSSLMVILMTGAIWGIDSYHRDGGAVTLRSVLLWGGVGLTATISSRSLRRRMASAEGQLAILARTDPLTGIANRRGFFEGVRERRGRRGFALVYLDLDGFKHLNDTEGHSAGDDLLRRAANALWGAVRAGDIVARLGGDEFVVFLADARSTEAEIAAGRLQEAIAALSQGEDLVRASVGFALGVPSSDLDAVLAAADRAMYENKRQAKTARARSKEVSGGAPLRLSPIG